MTKTTSDESLPPVRTRGESEPGPRIERELEVVMKSGGVYCFVAKRKTPHGEVLSAAVGVGKDQALMPVDREAPRLFTSRGALRLFNSRVR